MATYFQGNPEMPAPDGLQTLVLMNPSYAHFSDSLPPPSTNFVFFNSGAGNYLTSQNLHHAAPSQSLQLTGIPLPVSLSPTSKEPNSHPTHPHRLSASHGLIAQAKFNHWNPINSPGARESQRSTQGLSLSLFSQQPGYGSHRTGREISSPAQHAVSGEGIRISGVSSSVSGKANDVSGIHGVLLCSKYLKAAQDLLEEVVCVGTDEIKNESPRKPNGTKLTEEPSVTATKNGSDEAEQAGKDSPELSTAERQDIQIKRAKLINMLDEVEQRYRQYHHQMQIVISSFEQATGMGSARTYTSLALKTISKQFRSLKDTITGQIRAANKSLGEEDNAGGKIGSSRLKFVDHQLRQQRALQQLGMIQQNAWRPQRGLPERSVSVLRAWLFEHFLHPYPKDSDKQMLAKQTGLTRSQVSNWFINARVRLWKPMVEEMYVEETKEKEQMGSAETINKIKENSPPNSISPTGKAPPIQNLPPTSHSNDELSTLTASKSSMGGNVRSSSALRLPRPSDLGSSPKKQKNSKMIVNSSSNFIDGNQAQSNPKNIAVKVADEKPSRDEYSFPMNKTNVAGGFVEYPIGQIGRYHDEQYTTRFSGHGVSLTLGLPHHNFLPTHQPIHLGGRMDIIEPNQFPGINSPTPHPNTAFDNIDIQNRKRFVAQLLPDFVA